MANNEKQHADSVVIIPMYNEKENAAAIMRRRHGAPNRIRHPGY